MIVSFRNITNDQLQNCGGKCASLVKLTKAGLPVPNGYVLLKGSDINDVDTINWISNKTYAVRSSALNEDGEQASFAGAYETITDVKREDIKHAVKQVINSANTDRVKKYAVTQDVDLKGIAVVIQEFVRPEFAGVVFTADAITGSAAKMTGNYVKGEGELLVSGAANAETFTYNAIKYNYDGSDEFRKYAKTLYKYCCKIRNLWGRPMDIEWAVSQGKVYILQARPITTVSRGNEDTYELNGTCAGEYIMTRTNVGEIFGKPLSPVTFSIMQKIAVALGMPYFVDNVCGQAYLNISVVTSVLVALGMSEEKAFNTIGDITGKIPDGVKVPIFPVNKNAFIRNLLHLIRPKKKAKGKGLDYAATIEAKLQSITTSEDLRTFWDLEMLPFILTSLSEIMKGANIASIFSARGKIEKVCGSALTDRLLSGSTGILDSMKPLLKLEDLIDGKINEDEYIKECGHRHANEMELLEPYPYEIPDFLSRRIEDHKKSGVSVHRMKERSEKSFEDALKEFDEKYPSKKNWIRKSLDNYAKANQSRESVRGRGVKIFCALRKYLLKAGELEGVGDGIFMLYIDEVLELLNGNAEIRNKVAVRQKTYDRYLQYPQFPNILLGRFDPDNWAADSNRRNDFYSVYSTANTSQADEQIKGFPGAIGTVQGRVRVITDINDADSLQDGEILVTNATNIGWTMYFPRAAAIITDIGAPLSHAAIVAREFGIPAVVGCGNATTVLRTGDAVIVDGAAGTVQKVGNM
ncbi:MAG: phosphoenolpyruvate synthase [Saccharofermentans sp.]|nr:phosphoenolpyruvate synthase [Saccharofermentans sp.]